MTTPLELYRKDLERDDFSYDAAQEMAVTHLQRLYDDLVKDWEDHKNRSALKKVFGSKKKEYLKEYQNKLTEVRFSVFFEVKEMIWDIKKRMSRKGHSLR